VSPFGLSDPFAAHLGRAVFVLVVVNNAVFAFVSFLKAKPFTGVAAIAIPAVRLGGSRAAGEALGAPVLRPLEAGARAGAVDGRAGRSFPALARRRRRRRTFELRQTAAPASAYLFPERTTRKEKECGVG